MEQSEFEKRKKAKRKQKKKKLLVITALILAVVLLFLLYKAFFKKSGSKALITVTVRKETVKDQIQISGYIEPAQKQVLQAVGDGIVKRVNVKEGDAVKKGDLIFALDSSQQEFQIEKQELAIAQETVRGSSKQLSLMQEELNILKLQLKDRSIYAKFDGIIAALDISEGIYAKAQNNFGTLIDRSFLKATVSVAETDASRLAVGQKAILNFQAAPNVKVEGRVTAYPSIARQNSERGNTVLDVKIVVENPPQEILPGYSFSGIIAAGEDQTVLYVEQTAVFYDQGEPYVNKVIEGNATEKTKVEVETYVQGFVKILSGLEEGDVLDIPSSSGDDDRRR